jgi:hypothetical protein
MNCKDCKHSMFHNDYGICRNPVKTIYEVININDREVINADSPPPEVTASNFCDQFERCLESDYLLQSGD